MYDLTTKGCHLFNFWNINDASFPKFLLNYEGSMAVYILNFLYMQFFRKNNNKVMRENGLCTQIWYKSLSTYQLNQFSLHLLTYQNHIDQWNENPYFIHHHFVNRPEISIIYTAELYQTTWELSEQTLKEIKCHQLNSQLK